jgi:hypothetical protein
MKLRKCIVYAITLAVPSCVFGQVSTKINTSAPWQLGVCNGGGGILSVIGGFVKGNPSWTITDDQCIGAQLAANQCCFTSGVFTPHVIGTVNAELDYTFHDVTGIFAESLPGLGTKYSQQEKAIFKQASMMFKSEASNSTGALEFCGGNIADLGPLGEICTAASGILAGIETFLGGAYQSAVPDPPDPNFTVIAQPVIAALPPLTIPPGATVAQGDVVHAINALLQNGEQQVGYLQAVITAANRAQGAGDCAYVTPPNTCAYTPSVALGWQQKQTQAALTFDEQFAADLIAEPTLLGNVEQSFLAAGLPTITMSQSDFASLVASINANGLPAPVLQVLTELGDNGAAAASLISFLNSSPTPPGGFPMSFPQMLATPLVTSTLSQLDASLAIEFSAFSAKLQVNGPHFELNSTFTLGAATKGIDPISDIVILQIGPFSEAIPPGSFIETHNGKFVFEGTINGIKQEIQIAHGDTTDTFGFKIQGSGANLSTLTNPATVVLAIGYDLGAFSATLEN